MNKKMAMGESIPLQLLIEKLYDRFVQLETNKMTEPNVVCECCKKPMDGITIHSPECRSYYDNKTKTGYDKRSYRE